MGQALGTNREHEQYTYQGIADVAAPATVKVSFLAKPEYLPHVTLTQCYRVR